MNPELLAEVEQTAKKFAARHIEPIAADTDHNAPAFLEKIFTHGIEAGFDRFVLPEDAGGYGFGMAELCGLIRTLASACAAHALVFGVHAAIIKTIHGAGGENSSSLLDEVFSTGRPLAVAIPDPTDHDGFETGLAAKYDDSSNVMLNGEAGPVVNGTPGGYYLVFADDPDGKPVALLVKGETAGFHVGPAELTLGLRAMPMVECTSKEAMVSPVHVVAYGKDAMGLYQALLCNLSVVVSAAASGLMESATKAALAYAAERYQGGKMIIDHSHMRNILGAMSSRVASARGAVFYAASRPGELVSALGTKTTVCDQAMKVCTDAVQVLGGYGYMRDYGLEKDMRDAAVLALLPISNIRAELLIAAIEKSNL